MFDRLLSFLAWFIELLFWPVIEIATTRFRWAVVIPMLPISKLYSFIVDTRTRINFWLLSNPKRHQEKVQRVVESVKNRLATAPNKPMCTARPGWMSVSIFYGKYKSSMYNVNLNNFIDILSIDEKKGTVTVEPLVTCGQLTSTLLPLGWTIEVLPELDDLTVGGLINGFGIETSSHRFGLFQYICESFEIVLADGTCQKCSKTENPELYYNIPWSHGSLGFLVSAELKITRSKKFVELSYVPYTNQKDFLVNFEKESRNEENDFVEALSYSTEHHVLMVGKLADKTTDKGPILHLGRWYGPWFYKHVEGFLLKKKKAIEYVPLRDYYHRHTRSLFWEMSAILPFGHHWLFRYILGWLTPPSIAFLKLTTTKKLHAIYKKKHVDQDFLIPMKKLGDAINFSHENFAIYPLWLCPCKIFKTPIRGLINPSTDDDMFVDIGIYGIPPSARPENGETFEVKTALRKYEKFVRDVKGFQALYALTLQTPEEFQEMFDHTVWSQVRKKFKCEGALPAIYDKVSATARGATD